MYKHFSFTLFAVLLSFLYGGQVFAEAVANKAAPLRASYRAEQVSPSTYVIHGPLASPNPENQGFMNNPAFIVGDAGIVVIDSGSTVQVGDMVLEQIKSISDLPVVATLSTHIHGDHWLGNQAIAEAYPDAKHYAHPNLIEQANNGEGQAWVDLMLVLSEGASAGTVYYPPDSSTDDGSKLTIAGKTFLIYHDPIAHTNTDIAIQMTDESILFLGDTVMNGRLGRLDDGNFKGLIAFLDKMLTLDAKIFIPGHGASGTASVVEDYKGIMEVIYTTVAEQYENGLSDFEIKPMVEARIADQAHWTDIEESLGKLVSLAFLEVEEDSF